MFTKHVDTLVKFGLLSMTRVSGGHGTGTQWRLDLVNPCIVEALQPLRKKLDGAAVEVIDGEIRPGSAKNRASADPEKPAPRRQAPRQAPRSRA